MNKRSLKLGLVASAMALYFAGCSNDVLSSQDGGFTTVNSLDSEKCDDESEGSMAFVKSTATMYVCTEGEWVAMNDDEAVKFRCESKELKDKSGFAIICDGDTIGVINNGKDGADGKNGTNGKDGTNGTDGKNGTNGTNGTDGTPGTNGSNGVSVDTAAINKLVRDALSSASAKSQKDVNDAIKAASSASAKNQSDLNKAIDNANSASAKTQSDLNKAINSANSASDKSQSDLNKAINSANSASDKNQSDLNNAIGAMSSASAKSNDDVGNAVGRLSSAAGQYGDSVNSWFNDVYSSWNAEFEDKSCVLVDTVRNVEKSVMTVTIRCGKGKTTMDIPFAEVNENLAKVYKKHVVVRFPVQASKETKTKDIYEEIWKNLKGGENADLTVMDLDKNFTPNGKVFLQDLFASANKSFVTIEETNDKAVEYKIVRLEGDLDVTNLSTPIVKLRVNLNLTNNGFFAFGGFGSNATDIVYKAYVDLSDESDTVVVDFLTDYKAARVKTLVDGDASKFAAASAQANKELANALSLKRPNVDVYPSFEHFVPDQVGLAENFNSIVWVMALIDQKNKTPGFNAVYNAFREVFAENGNLYEKAINTTYAGQNRSMYFVDYLALLIDANFYKWAMITQNDDYVSEADFWMGTDAYYYTIVQNGFVDTYGLDESDATPFDTTKVFKSEVKNGYFRYFEYSVVGKIWRPIAFNTAAAATAEEGVCNADNENTLFMYSFAGVDDNAACYCSQDNDQCEWIRANLCLNREKGDTGYRMVRLEEDGSVAIRPYECVNDDNGSLVAIEPGASTGESSEQNGRTPEELANDGRLGKCDASHINEVTLFDERNVMLATTTEHAYWKCNGQKWVKASDLDVYCRGDNLQSMTQKVKDEDLKEQTYEKCVYKGTAYYKQKNSTDATWLTRDDLARLGSNNLELNAGFIVVLNGYNNDDNAVYQCVDDGSCEVSSLGQVQDTMASLRSKSSIQLTQPYLSTNNSNENQVKATNLVNLLCNMGEYEYVASSGDYANGIYYKVEVKVFSANEDSRTFVAGQTRTDWHEVTVNDYIKDKCTQDQMQDGALATINEKSYKCNRISTEFSNNESGYFSWILASKLDTSSLGVCTFVHTAYGDSKNYYDVGIVDNKYYGCIQNKKDDTGNYLEGLVNPESSTSTDWKEISQDEYFNNLFESNCRTSNDETKDLTGIKTAENSDGSESKYKCSLIGDNKARWVDASTDVKLNAICNSDNNPETVVEHSGSFYRCEKDEDENKGFQWKEGSL